MIHYVVLVTLEICPKMPLLNRSGAERPEEEKKRIANGMMLVTT